MLELMPSSCSLADHASLSAYRSGMSVRGVRYGRALREIKVLVATSGRNLGFQKMQASMVRRWLHELEPVNHLENLGPPRSLCLFPTNPKPENIRCRRNTEDTRRLSSASSHAARPLGRTTAALAVEWTSRTPRVTNVRYKPAQIRQLSEQEG